MQLNVDTGTTSVSIRQLKDLSSLLTAKHQTLLDTKTSLTEKFVTTLLLDSILKRLKFCLLRTKKKQKLDMHICRNSLHCTVLKNKIDLNRGQGRKSLTPFVVAHSKVWEWYVVERDWKFMYK